MCYFWERRKNKPALLMCVLSTNELYGKKTRFAKGKWKWNGKEKGAIIESCSTGSSDAHITKWNLSLNNMMIKKNPIVVA